ncbi:MAG: hypothetical protein Kow0092_18180 [Deferrisomatales bacterium]
MRSVLVAGTLSFLLAAAGMAGASSFAPDSLVWKKCTACHEPSGGRIPAVEEIRTTPEEWTVIVDRMARLHGMELASGDMATLLKELCATQILSPEEAADVAYLSLFNNPQTVEAPRDQGEERLFATCVRCHSAGKIRSYRMAPARWANLRNFHHYMDPAIIFQMREMHWRDEAEAVLRDLAGKYPYGAPWQAPAATPAGSWLILGREPGRGIYRGSAEIADRGDGEFAVSGAIRFADGSAETFRGEGTLYGGYAVRTRTRHNGFDTVGAYTLDGDVLRGAHHFPAPDFRTSQSSWYRRDGRARVLRVTPDYLVAGEETRVLVEGTRLPDASTGEVSFSGGAVEVLGAKRLGPEALELTVRSRAAGPTQARLSVNGLDGGTVRLVPSVDGITVTPHHGRARLSGGAYYPAEGVQFEAVAYYGGADRADPSDDVVLGPVPATFRLEEAETRPGDDDLRWVGGIDADGTYIPVGDYKPIAAREYSGEGSGWVKVVAEYRRGASAYRGEAFLAVTVPDFIQRIR